MHDGEVRYICEKTNQRLETYHVSPQLHGLGRVSVLAARALVWAAQVPVTLIRRALVFGKLAGGSRADTFSSLGL